MAACHVLVTGATGFIGKHLVSYLARQPGIMVWAVSKNGGQVGGTRVDAVDLTSLSAFDSWLKGKPIFKAIFHLAATVPSSFHDTQVDKIFFPNFCIDYNVVSLAIYTKARLIYISSSSIYGQDSPIPFREEMISRPDNWYTLSKSFGEMLGQMAQAREGLTACSLRISAPYGPGQKSRTVIKIFLEAAFASRDLTLFGSGNRTQDFTYVADIVEAMWLAYKKQASGIYNIASGRPVSMKHLAEVVLSLVPSSASKIVYSEQMDPQENYRGVFDIEKARRDLGYNPMTSLEDGLRACLADLVGQR